VSGFHPTPCSLPEIPGIPESPEIADSACIAIFIGSAAIAAAMEKRLRVG
jgi:hypothetical protein